MLSFFFSSVWFFSGAPFPFSPYASLSRPRAKPLDKAGFCTLAHRLPSGGDGQGACASRTS